MMKKIILLFVVCIAVLFLQGCIEHPKPESKEPTPTPTPEVTPELEKTPVATEKIDCGVFSGFSAGKEFDCYCKAFHECKPATLTSTELGTVGIIGLEIIGLEEGECKWKFTITSPEEETAYSECIMPVLPKELKQGQECVEEIIIPSTLFENHGNSQYCQGSWTTALLQSCESACKKKGYEHGFCKTQDVMGPIPKSIRCTSGSENYAGHLFSCKQNRVINPCCCYNGELEILEGDLAVSGDLKIGKSFKGEFLSPDCFGWQDLYFKLKNSYPEALQIPIEIYIDGKKIEIYIDGKKFDLDNYNQILKYAGAGFGEDPWSIPPGENIVYTRFEQSTPGHTIRVVVDPENIFKETDETNNVIETTFNPEKMDLSYVSADPKGMFGKLEITIKRDKVVEYCPPFDFELYVDGESAEASFFGFDGNKLESSVRGPELEPGTHEIRLVIDSENVVEESNEENNDITFAVDVPGTES